MTKTLTSFRLLRAILIMLVLAMFVPARAAIDITATKPANGTGTTDDPYQIGTPGELYWFAEQVNNGQNTLCAKLTADIVVNENVLKAGTFALNVTPTNVWTPIGTSSNTFKGTFDGNGHTISGLYYNTTGSSYIGLIGSAYGATIKNVVVKDSYLRGYDYLAGICGFANNSTKITNCGYVGYSSGYGIASYNYSATVENCYSVSNQPLARYTTTNCYHDNNKFTGSTLNSIGKPSTAFANGEVAWLLGDAWGQKIGTDATPRPGGDKVYATALCPHTNSYSNTPSVYTPIADGDEHYDADGFCKVCGVGHPATLVDGYYEIDNVGKLYWFAAKVNGGQTTINAKLVADIVVNENVLQPGTFTLNGTPSRRWTSIGTSDNQFKGTFDGNGHTISGLYFNNRTNSYYPAGGIYIGLIGYASGATIKNVVVKDSYLRGYDDVAGICGYAKGSTQITNCGYEGYVYSSSYAYGIAYNYSATVENCYSVSNLPLASRTTTNCYYDNIKNPRSSTVSTGKPSAAFANGEVAFLLGEGWGQKIGTDATPRLGGDKVYATAICPHANSYSNIESVYTPIADGDENYDADGFCKVCGAGQPATLVDGYYEIDNVSKLYWFANQVNNGQNTISAKLTADIVVNENVLNSGTFTLNGTPANEWTPIGRYSNDFKGTFDGNGHTISGLYFNNTSSGYYPDGGQYIGLIGYASGATIKNVVVKDSYLKGYSFVSGICGYATGSTQITNCGYVGYSSNYGIAFNNPATVENCYSVSNQPLAYYATTNCYHDNNKYTGSSKSTGKSSEAFASGEVAFLLGEAWGQKIGTDATPKLGGEKVYVTIYTECPGHSNNYSNEGPATYEKRDHVCDANGKCTRCGLYIISNADQLFEFAAKVNAGQTTISAKLAADIVVNENVLNPGTFDLNGTPSRIWTPIGTYSNKFQGTFDGNGHTISGLYFNNTSSSNYPAGGDYIGLIGYANGATIKNVVVKDSYLRGYDDVAGICGYATRSNPITNCGYEGAVYVSSNHAYGIAYNYETTVENCYSVSNKRLAYGTTTNCYHNNTKYTETSTTFSTGKPSEAFASGEVAFLLGEAWGQKIGTDVLPIPGRDKVYKNTYSGECSGEAYSNVDNHGVVTNRNHNFNEEGVCTQCGFHLISTADQLYAFAAKVNAGQTTISAKLTADIVVNENVLKTGTLTLNGTPANVWTPIGTSYNNFKGTFDGNGHTISGLYFNNTTNSDYPAGGNNIGLIGEANGATIKNVVVKDSYIKGYSFSSGICGYASGSTQITNCGYEGYVYGSSYAYGITYNANATVENCYSVSNLPLAGKATTNCYHDNSKYTGSTAESTGKLSTAFASGEVAFLLGDAWGQKIGTDATPRLGGDKVYKNTYSGECSGEGYSNVDEHGVVTERNHNCNEEDVCIQCSLHFISTADQLYAFAAKVNAGGTTLCAKLTADIVVNENVLNPGTFDLNGTPSRSWTPIGTSYNNFKGTFDGNGHTISGLYFNNTTNSNYPAGGKFIGLIGKADGATIKNVVVKDSYLNGYNLVAGICGGNASGGSTKITNCGYEGYVYGSLNDAYGIAYNYETTVENCYSVSNQPLAYYATTNCYHDNNKCTRSTTASIGKPSAAFANGEVAFLLGDAWGQKFGTDATPRLGGDKVYKNTYSGECPGEGYSNVDEHGVVTERNNHICNEDGVCIQCGLHLISTADQLYAFAAKVNAGGTTLCAKLTADIVVNENVLQPGTFTLNGTPANVWTPIGTSSNKFQGTFDGNGHTISGLYFNNRTNSDYPAGGNNIGLIGYANGATIKNVVVNDSYLYGYQYVAGICGGAYGSTQITNCGYEGYVYGYNSYAYGIAYNYFSTATIKNCYSVSNKLLAYNATTNCYHDINKYTGSATYSTGKSSEAFASGEVAFLLGDAWGQKIGTDATPRLGGDKVYMNTYSGECSGEGYSNVDEHGVVTNRNHNFNEEGVCTQCGLHLISTADQLYAFAAKVNAGQTTISAKLTADIVVNENVLNSGTFDLNGTPSRSWTPIGTYSKNFKGTFDGNGHTISGLYFNNYRRGYYPDGGVNIGLIGYANGATIKNVVVKDSYLYGSQYVAGICGYAYGSTQITNCGYEGYVFGYGIAYNESAIVENCYSVSNQPLAYKTTTNCYHDINKYTGSSKSTGKSSEAFASGEVAFLLGDAWGQKIGTDATPKLGGAVIYSITTTIATGGHGTFICPSYANEGETITCSSEPNIGYELVLKVNGNAHTGNTFTMPAENTTLLVDFTKIDYAVTTATGLTGGSVSAAATAQYQDEVTVTVTPATGYKLDAISVKDASDNAVSVSNGKFTMPASAVNVTASFSKIDYAVTTATDLTGGSVSAAATAQYQDQVTITATPAVGYKLNAITVKDASNNAVAVTNGKFTMPASAVSVSASFSKIDYAVTTATGLTGGSVSADATAQYQDEVTVTVTPATGYKLDAISVKDASDNAVSVSNGKFTMPASAVNVSASFSKIDYAVTTATGLTGGSVSADATAQYQDQVTVTATPAVGYKLDAITVKDASNNAVAVTNGKFTMPASAVNVTASFSKIDYAVTTATGLTGGSVSADATAQYQDEVTVTVTPATGYKLDAISVKDASDNAVSVSNGKFTMPASAVNVSASFSKIDYAVTTATGLTGGSVSAAATAQYQDQVTVTATPAVGYKLDAISVTDASNNAVAVTNGKFTMPASAVSVTAQFSKIDYVINVVSEHGKVNVVETANYGDEVEFAIVADSSYQLKSVDVVGQSAITVTDGKFTMPASNVTITVTYDKILDFVKVIYMGFRADSTIDQVYQSIRIPDDANYIMGEYALLVSNEVSDNLQDYTDFDENATDVIDYNKYYGAAFMLGPKDGYVFANTITFVCGNDTAEVEPMNIPMSPTQSMQVVVHYQLNIKAFKHFHAYDFHRFEWAADSLSAVPVYQCESDQIDSLGVAVASVFSEKMVSCTNNGERKFNVEVEYKGVTYRDSISTIIPAWGHDWNDAVVVWDSITPAQVTDWTAVTTSSTTTRVCKTDNFVETETVNANFTITEQPTCVTAGAGYFKAEFENEAFESQIYEIEIPALGHDWDLTEYIWSTVSSTVDVDWSQVSSTCTAIHTCKVEGAKEVETVYATILVTEPTCTTEGLVMFTATFSNPAFGIQTDSIVLPKLEHNWSDVSYKWSSDNTTCTASRSCSVGGETERETATATRTVVVEPTATTEGKAVCSVTFSNSAFDSQEVEVVLPKLDAIADSELQMAKIWASNYQIVVENAMSQVVEVYTVNGSKVFSGVATSDRFEIDMTANTALYIVRVNNQVERVVLK